MNGQITFWPTTRADFPLLAQWLAEPHVRRWWNHDPDAVEVDFSDVIDGLEPAEDHLILLEGRPVGLMQFCRFTDYPESVAEMDPVYPVGAGAATIDYLIGPPELVGQGLGPRVIAAFVERVWDTHPEVTHLVVPVNSANRASWRALQKAGFEVVARGDLEPDNPVDPPAHEVLRLDRPR